jgi:hypothetical protein
MLSPTAKVQVIFTACTLAIAELRSSGERSE